MLPILIAAAAGLLVLGGGKKKRRKSSGSKPPGNGNGNGGNGNGNGNGNGVGGVKIMKADLPQTGGKLGEPWSYCKPPKGSPQGTYAAVSKDGNSCMVYWTPETRDTAVAYLEDELSKFSQAEQEELCASDNCVPDQFSMEPELLCDWVPNPKRVAFVKKVVLRMYPQIPSNALPLPPPDNLGRVDAPYFVKNVWARVEAIFGHDFCGFNPVT